MQRLLEKKLKVAIYSGFIPAPFFIEVLIKELARNNLDIFIFGRKKSDYKFKSQKNISTFLSPSNKILLIPYTFLQMLHLFFTKPKFLFKLYIYYQANSKRPIKFFQWWSKVLPVVIHLPDIFHIQWAKSLPEWFFLKELFGVKIVLSLRGTQITSTPLSDKYFHRQYKKLFSKVDGLHAVSKSLSQLAKKYIDQKQKIKIIYSAIHVFPNRSELKEIKKYENSFNFISVGRFHWMKGYQYTLSALQILLNENYKVKYTILSIDEPTDEALYQISDLNIEEHVQILVGLNQNRVFEKMRDSDCLILPSVSEGLANVVLESMSIGLPVLSSNCGGMGEVIKDNFNGFIFDNRSVNNLIKKMRYIIEIENKIMKKIAINGYNFVKNQHTTEKLVFGMKSLYKKTLEPID